MSRLCSRLTSVFLEFSGVTGRDASVAPRSCLVGLAGFEPTTFGPPDRRANQAAPQPVVETP